MRKYTKEDLARMGKYALLSLMVLGGTIATSILKKEAEISLIPKGEATYGAAIDAVMSSGMLSAHKSEAVKLIPRGEDEALYSGIISIARSTTMSRHKVNSIADICRK